MASQSAATPGVVVTMELVPVDGVQATSRESNGIEPHRLAPPAQPRPPPLPRQHPQQVAAGSSECKISTIFAAMAVLLVFGLVLGFYVRIHKMFVYRTLTLGN